MLDFTLTEEQLMMQKMARDFAEKEVKPIAMARDKMQDPFEAFPADVVKKSFELGFHKMTIPEQYGGLGLDCLTHCLVLEEFAAADAGFALGYDAHAIVASIALENGTEEQRETFVKSLTEGEGGWCAAAATEPNTGPSAFFTDHGTVALDTFARREGDEYVINGEKIFCTNAGSPFTKWYRIMARTDKSRTGLESTSVFFVWAGTPGLNVVKLGQDGPKAFHKRSSPSGRAQGAQELYGGRC